MTTSVFEAASRQLAEAALTSRSVLVAFSGGKDSLAVLDLCKRAFERVVCFHMYFVPGLQVVEDRLEMARQRWGVEILYVPHWLLFRCLRGAIYCPRWPVDRPEPPDWKVGNVYDFVARETGIELIATGAKDSDSRTRRLITRNQKRRLLAPLKSWTKFDVLAYLRHHDIPLPDQSSGQATGIDLSTPSLLWLADNHPEDFQRLLAVFPFAEAAVRRREWYGVQ